jgi:hypothetical protein
MQDRQTPSTHQPPASSFASQILPHSLVVLRPSSSLVSVFAFRHLMWTRDLVWMLSLSCCKTADDQVVVAADLIDLGRKKRYCGRVQGRNVLIEYSCSNGSQDIHQEGRTGSDLPVLFLTAIAQD